MKEKYIILRGRGFAAGLGATPFEVAAEPAPAFEVDELDYRKAAQLSARADIQMVAPAMPMRLTQPVEMLPVTAPAQGPGTAWGVHAVKADTSPFDGEGIVVAMLDTGIDATHPAFSGVTFVQENFTDDPNGGDTVGHGTHCAGTIFGRDVDGFRIGVARGVAKALIGKVLSDKGGSSERIADAMQWAVNNGAHVISMSLGIDFPGYSAGLQERGFPPELAISRALVGYRMNVLLFERLASALRARAQATLIVAAAGNESRRKVDPRFEIAVSPPAVSEGIVSVAALGQDAAGLSVAEFSNTGALISGPGVSIISAAVGGGLRTMSGTSMATPHVAGVAALWAQKLIQSSPLGWQIFNARVLSSGTSNGFAPGFDPTDTGAGLATAPQ
ncbi:S8 family peptidase [Paraburkholderia guartelaensis]|nr:S8 family serine peptidase [Paraburkholderia guartelaensis]